MLQPELRAAVQILVKHYKLHLLEKETLLLVAEDTQWVPSVEDVEWLVEEAKLKVNSAHKLPIWLYPYMEFYPWYLRNDGVGGDKYRVFLGVFKYFDGSTWELWAEFKPSQTGPQVHLYHDSIKIHSEREEKSLIKPTHRRFLTWLPSIELCFRLDDMLPEDFDAEDANREGAAQQDSYIKGMMKVLARFPGMIVDRDD